MNVLLVHYLGLPLLMPPLSHLTLQPRILFV